MEVQVLSSAPRARRAGEPDPGCERRTSCSHPFARAPVAATLLAALAAGCDRGHDAPITGSLSCEPAVLVAPPSDQPLGVLRGRLAIRFDAEVPAGSSLRIRQGYDEDGRRFGGSELRYALAPIPELGGRALGVGARVIARGGGDDGRPLLVRSLPPELGWLEVAIDRRIDPGDGIEILLGTPGDPGSGVPTNPLPLEVELSAEVDPGPGGRVATLAGRAPVRVAASRADWLRVLAPAQADPGAALRVTITFMSGFSGPLRSSHESLLPAGRLEITGPFGTVTADVAAEEGSPEPLAVEVALPALPPGVHRLAARFGGEGGLRGLSPPIVVGGASRVPTWFGSLHQHTVLGGHATSTPPRALRYARSVSRLDFVALSEHREAATFDGEWLAELARDHSRDDEFVVFTAFEWTNADAGHRHVVARTPRVPPPAPPTLAELAAGPGHDPDWIVIGHHSIWFGGSAQRSFTWGEPGAIPRQLLAEAYSWHGCSLAHDSPFPLHGNREQVLPRELRSDVLSALEDGHDLFVVADSDGHLGKPGSLIGIEWPKGRRYAYGGLVAARAPRRTHDAIFRALESGAVYGTTGARLLVDARRVGGGALEVAIHAAAPLARVVAFTPKRTVADFAFDPVEPDDGLPDAPLFVDPARGVWDWSGELDVSGVGPAEPLLLEVVQHDFHRAWMRVAR